MEEFDAVIVGAGPSGSTCAWKLRQAGLRTLILDKQNFPRDKPCAGWITPQVVQSLRLDCQEYQANRTWQPITGFRCSIMGCRETQIDYQTPISFGIRRFEFDRYLLDRCGSERSLNECVDKIERRENHWILNGRYRARMLIGAGGTHCPVARWLGVKRKDDRSTVVAQEVEFKAADGFCSKVRGEVPVLYFCRDLLGYGWCFRKGDYLNIGLGRTDNTHFKNHLRQFQAFLATQAIDCQAAGKPWKGHSYQIYMRQPRTLFADGVLLVGDAAGLAYAQSGEGIRPAIESSFIAAEVIISANGDYQKSQLESYPIRLEEQLGKPQSPSFLSRLPVSWLAALGSGLLSNAWFSRHVLFDRWFLHRSKEAMAG